MGIKVGLVGLPNVEKSTLFNALTKSSVPAENYPFCTIDPHVAITEVNDHRLDQLQKVFGSQKKLSTTVTFVDIAGLVKGAAEGEGLGNQFLGHIREVDLILHVLRCFENDQIIHVANEVDPIEDYEVIVTELVLKDLESIQARLEKLPRQIKIAQNDAKLKAEIQQEESLLLKIKDLLNNDQVDAAKKLISETPVATIPLLSLKNFLIVANFAESELENEAYKNNPHYKRLVEKFGSNLILPVSAKLELEFSQLEAQDVEELMKMLNIQGRGLDDIISASYGHLGLITFFTCGPKEAHAWPIKRGITVRKAAGEIHSDLEKGFICAEVYNCEDLFGLGTEAALKLSGKIRTEGQDYIMQDGDIINVRFNV